MVWSDFLGATVQERRAGGGAGGALLVARRRTAQPAAHRQLDIAVDRPKTHKDGQNDRNYVTSKT